MMRSPSTRFALAVAIVALAGCGGGDDTTTSSSPAKSSKAAKPRHAAKLSPAAQRELNRRLREVDRLNRRLKGPDTPAERVQGAVKFVLTATTSSTTCTPPVESRNSEVCTGMPAT